MTKSISSASATALPETQAIERMIHDLPDHRQIRAVYDAAERLSDLAGMLAGNAIMRGMRQAEPILAQINEFLYAAQTAAVARAGNLKATSEDEKEAKFRTLINFEVNGLSDLECAEEVITDLISEYAAEVLS